jgi:hypothetical protein
MADLYRKGLWPMTGINRRMLAAGLLAAAALATTAGGTHGRGPAGVGQAGAGQAAAGQAAAAPACPGWRVVAAKDPAAELNDFFGVAVLSAVNVWAVGDYTGANGFRTLIEHWNGKTWTRVVSPDPGRGDNILSSVTAVSATDIWAVGEYATQASSPGNIIPDKTLIVHWNGHQWRQVRSPSPGGFIDEMTGIGKISAKNIWAVGYYGQPDTGGKTKSLILHWNGHAWGQLHSPNYGTENNTLTSVAGTAGNSVWVADLAGTTTSSRALLLHWNGHAWGKAASLADADYDAIGFSSAKNGWTVGGDKNGRSLALRWNGRSWTRVSTPSLKNLTNTLLSVTVLSPVSAWAVGDAEAVFDGDTTAIEMHWNGHKWSMMTSPAPGANSSLSAVQATPSTAPWAVGEFGSQATVQRALVFRCR